MRCPDCGAPPDRPCYYSCPSVLEQRLKELEARVAALEYARDYASIATQDE